MAPEANASTGQPPEDETRRNEVMFNLAKEVFAEELTRGTRLEDKAGRFITVIGLLFAVLTWVGQAIGAKIFPPGSWVEWALTVVMALLFLTLGGGGWFCFQALRLGQLTKISIDKDVFTSQSLTAAYEGYTNQMIRKLQKNREVCDLKVRRLEHAFTCLSAVFALAPIGGVLITLHLWQHPA